MTETRALFLGCGIAPGKIVIENDRLARILDTDDAWIRERTGIERRCFVTPGIASSDLGVEAARAAIEDAGIEAGEIDYIICATMTPDRYFPGSATPIQDGLGIPRGLHRPRCGDALGLGVAARLKGTVTTRSVSSSRL